MKEIIVKRSDEKMAYDHPHEPYEPFNLETAKKLVIGTICPPNHSEFLRRQTGELGKNDWAWFYGVWGNGFWEVIERILKVDWVPCEVDVAKQFALDYSIGFVDVVKQTYRIKDSASDGDLRNVTLRDMSAVLELNRNPEIRLFFTSEQAAKWFALVTPGLSGFDPNNRKKPQVLQWRNKMLQTLTLYSPSGIAARKRPENWTDNYRLLLQ